MNAFDFFNILLVIVGVLLFLPFLLNPLGTLRTVSGAVALGAFFWAMMPGHAWWWWLVSLGAAALFTLITVNTQPVQRGR